MDRRRRPPGVFLRAVAWREARVRGPRDAAVDPVACDPSAMGG